MEEVRKESRSSRTFQIQNYTNFLRRKKNRKRRTAVIHETILDELQTEEIVIEVDLSKKKSSFSAQTDIQPVCIWMRHITIY